MSDGDPDEPGVDVTDLLAATYRRGQRHAFTEAANLVEAIAFDVSFRMLVVMLRRRADPDVKAGADV